MDEQFFFSRKYKNSLVALVVAGLVVCIAGILISKSGGTRIWANVLLNNCFFLGIALGAAFFIAVHRVALSGWHTAIQTLPGAMTTFIPVAFVLMLLIYFGMHSLYYWSDYQGHDIVLDQKKAWLNIPFFFVRMIIYFAGWIALTWWMRKDSLALISSSDLKFYKRGKIISGVFLAFYGVTVSSSAWDWIMSLNPYWDSTLYGWYVFIGMFVTALTVIIILIAFLRRIGYLKFLRVDHVQDLGIYLFSFSIFWAYLWFSQYLLIWYGHLPQETQYYIPRLYDFKPFFFLNLFLNFVIPFFGLIRVSSKRQLSWLTTIAVLVLIGHWLDYWLMIMPSAVGKKAVIGLPEIAMTVFYAGIFIFIVFRSLSRYPLIIKNDPFLEESMNYEA